jgi:hypothetical protein
MSYRLPSDLEKVAVRLYDGIATPISLACKKALETGAWDTLASMRVSPGSYSNPDQYWLDACAVSFLRKVESLPTSFDRAAKARENFWKGERDCWRSNYRLLPYLRDSSEFPGDPAVRSLLERARKIVVDIIGHSPPADLAGRFGPGATYGDKGQLTTIPDKMSSSPTLTCAAKWYLWSFHGTLWASACNRHNRSPVFVRGNRFTTVPKDCEKDRGIAVEPSINLFFQLGYGRILRDLLCRAGLDLVKAQHIHRQVACAASVTGNYATLDLSNASDTICSALVKLLLPRKWFEALDELRSTKTLIENRWVLLEKFSSMGNGFTFELETLIFSAISKAVLDMLGQPSRLGSDVYVFGDDIIVPTVSASTVIAALRFLGFTLNEEKSFTSGPFRESCGGDYFKGVDVRPHFLDDYPNEPQKLISLANGIRRAASQGGTRMDPRFLRAWLTVLDCLPSHIRRLRGPSRLGDLVVQDDPSLWRSRWRSGIRYIQVYRPASFRKVGWDHFSPTVILASAVYGVGDGAVLGGTKGDPFRWILSDGVIPRDSVSGYKLGWVPFS